jgi:hypothetical protein
MKNPNELWGEDDAPYVVVRVYLHAIRSAQPNMSAFIRESNPSLTEYFDYVDREVRRNPYYDL